MVSVTSGIQVLDRAVLVLDTVARGGPCSLAELQRATGLPRPTAYRLAVALERHGVLARDDGRALRARPPARRHGARSPAAVCPTPGVRCWRGSGRRRARARSSTCARATTACASPSHERPSGLRDTVPLGAVLPLDRGSGGKVLLAVGGRRASVRRSTPRARDGAPAGLGGERGRARGRRGSVSAPVFAGPGSVVVAAVSVSGPIDRLGPHPGRRLAAAVTAASAALSAALGGPAATRTSRRGNKGVTNRPYRRLRERRGRPMAGRCAAAGRASGDAHSAAARGGRRRRRAAVARRLPRGLGDSGAPEWEVDARRRALLLRSGQHAVRPLLDEDGLLHHRDAWVSLSPVEQALAGVLLDRFGAVVTREMLADRAWPAACRPATRSTCTCCACAAASRPWVSRSAPSGPAATSCNRARSCCSSSRRQLGGV